MFHPIFLIKKIGDKYRIKMLFFGLLQAPTPLTHWNQTVMADKEGPICPQIPNARGSDTSSQQSENCLFLNIYSPVAVRMLYLYCHIMTFFIKHI